MVVASVEDPLSPQFPTPALPVRGWRYENRGDRVISWLSPRGDLLDLTDAQAGGYGYSVLTGVRGLDAADPELTVNEILSGGSVAQHWRPTTREIFLPVRVEAGSRADFLARKRALLAAFNHAYTPGTLRPGVLTVTELDGTSRQIEAYRAGPGLEGDESDEGAGPDWAHVGLLLHAPAPYWLAATTRVVTWAERDPIPYFPYYPLRLAPDRDLGTSVDVNPGDVEAHPVWDITGPCDSVGANNLTTGRSFTYGAALPAGVHLHIDTAPLAKTVRLGDGSNVRGNVTPASWLWSLAPGENTIELVLAGAVAGATTVVMTYRPRHEGA